MITAPIQSESVKAEGEGKRVPGQHYWIWKRSLPGVVLCKWCGLTRSPAAKARRCDPLPAFDPDRSARTVNPSNSPEK